MGPPLTLPRLFLGNLSNPAPQAPPVQATILPLDEHWPPDKRPMPLVSSLHSLSMFHSSRLLYLRWLPLPSGSRTNVACKALSSDLPSGLAGLPQAPCPPFLILSFIPKDTPLIPGPSRRPSRPSSRCLTPATALCVDSTLINVCNKDKPRPPRAWQLSCQVLKNSCGLREGSPSLPQEL